jgi:hypothetical protein
MAFKTVISSWAALPVNFGVAIMGMDPTATRDAPASRSSRPARRNPGNDAGDEQRQ